MEYRLKVEGKQSNAPRRIIFYRGEFDEGLMV